MYLTTLVCVLITLFSIDAFPESKLTRKTDDRVIGDTSIERCPIGNNSVLAKCLQKIVKSLTPRFGPGVGELNLPPLDPFILKKFIYNKSFGPLNIAVHNNNMIINRFTKYNFLKLGVDAENLKIKFMYEVPHIQGQTDYELNGNFSIIPFHGTGPANFEVFNMRANGEIRGKFDRNSKGEEIIQVEKIQFTKLSIDDMNLSIKGLFNEDVVIGSVIHYFAKRFAPQFFEVTRPEVEEFVGNYIAHDLLNPILKTRPYMVEYIPRS